MTDLRASVLAAAAVLSFLAAAFGVGAFVRWSGGRRLLDLPNERSSHQRPVPRGGGAVIVAIVATIMAWPAWLGLFTVPGASVAAIAIALVSAADDVRSLDARVRLGVHVACAVLALWSLGLTSVTSGPGALAAGLALLWVVGLTNAYNFMDGIDGIAGMQALVTASTVAVAGWFGGVAGAAVAGAAIAGAAAGFLIHNWAPARVFMGDVGGAFLGFAFAVLALRIGQASPGLGVAVALSLWPFVFDTGFTLVRRALRHENLLEAHRSHLYQRLVACGWSHAHVTLLYGAGALIGSLLGLIWITTGRAVFLLLIPTMAGGIWTIVRRQESVARRRSGHQASVGTQRG